MKAVISLLLLLALGACLKASLSTANHPEALMPIMTYCKYFKYPVEAHTVTT